MKKGEDVQIELVFKNWVSTFQNLTEKGRLNEGN